MINYSEINEALYQTRRQILVVYRGEKPLGERKALDKLRAFHFVSDQIRFMHYLCGMEYSGLIIEEDATLSIGNMRYVITRFRANANELVLSMDDAHKQRLDDVLEDMWHASDDKDRIESFMKRVELAHLNKIN